MQINREFWSGETSTVTDGSSARNERYTFITNTLYSSIVANSEKYNGEWDKTICPWKINGNADIMQTEFVLPWYNGTSWNVSTSDFHKKRKKGYTFYLSCNGSNFQDRYDLDKYFANYCGAWLSMPSNPDYDINDTVCKEWTESKFDRINPIINFDYANIFIVPTVNGNELTPNLETNFDPTTIYNIGFTFYYKDFVGTNREMASAVVSLNNEIDKPSWSEYNTNCWDLESQYDNGFMITPYWIEHTNFHAIPALGTRANAQTMPWRSSSAEFITGATGTGFSNTNTSGESTAATINYFPNKATYISTGKSELWDNYEVYYDGGTSGFQYAVRRHLKSTVTYADLIEYIAKECAYLGFKFCLDSTRKNEDINSQYFYLPEIDDKGVTTGNYYAANSTDAQNLINYDWSTNVYTETPYDGTDDIEDNDPNEYDTDNETILNSNAFNAPSARFQNYYIIPPNRVVPLIRYMYSDLPTSQPQNDYLTSNTIDCVVSFMSFPFAIAPLVGTEDIEVYFGKVNSGLQTKGLIPALIQKIDCGECTYYSPYGADDFRSYEPYYTAEIYLPYCGNVKLNPSIFLNANNNTKIKVEYLVDLVTGACIAMVYRDNLVVEMATGQIGLNLPLTGVQSADLQRDITNKQAALKNARNTALASVARTIATASGAASNTSVSSIAGVVSGVTASLNALESAKVANYELEHVQVPYNVKGGASPLTDYAYEQIPRITFRRPVMLPEYNAENYGHSIGFATIQNDTIGNYSGYTEITGVDLTGIPATAEEIQMIKSALESGVYL